MGKTPAQEARAAAKKEGMSHDKMKQQAAAEAHKLKQLANKDVNFGKAKGAGMNTKVLTYSTSLQLNLGPLKILVSLLVLS